MLCVGRGEGTPPCWIIFRILLVQIVEALGGDDGLDLGAQGGEGLGQVVIVQASSLQMSVLMVAVPLSKVSTGVVAGLLPSRRMPETMLAVSTPRLA